MGAKEGVFKSEVKHGGIFNFKDLYKFSYDFLVDKEYDVLELEYSEKVGADGKEIEVKWALEKKVSDYHKYLGKVKFTCRGLTDVEAESNGKKRKMNKGEVKVAVSAEIERDYDNKWDKSNHFKFMRGIYDKFLMLSRYKELKDKLGADMDEFLSQVKSFLVLEGIK